MRQIKLTLSGAPGNYIDVINSLISFVYKLHLSNPEHLVMLLAGPVSHTGIQYMDLSTVYFAHFSDVELPLRIVVTLS